MPGSTGVCMWNGVAQVAKAWHGEHTARGGERRRTVNLL